MRRRLTNADGVLLRHKWDIDEIIEGTQAIGRDLLVALVKLIQDVLDCELALSSRDAPRSGIPT